MDVLSIKGRLILPKANLKNNKHTKIWQNTDLPSQRAHFLESKPQSESEGFWGAIPFHDSPFQLKHSG